MDPKINQLAKRFLDATVNQRWGLDKEGVLDVLDEVSRDGHVDFKDGFKQAIYNRLDLTRHKDLLTKGKDSIVNAILLEKADVPFFKKARYVFDHANMQICPKTTYCSSGEYVDYYDVGVKKNNLLYSFLSFLGLDRFIYDRDALVKE